MDTTIGWMQSFATSQIGQVVIPVTNYLFTSAFVVSAAAFFVLWGSASVYVTFKFAREFWTKFYEILNGKSIPKPPNPPPIRVPKPVKIQKTPRKDDGNEALATIVRSLAEQVREMRIELETFGKDNDELWNRTRRLMNDIDDIDETLGEIRDWKKQSKLNFARHDDDIFDLQERSRQHHTDLETIAFSPRKTVGNERSNVDIGNSQIGDKSNPFMQNFEVIPTSTKEEEIEEGVSIVSW